MSLFSKAFHGTSPPTTEEVRPEPKSAFFSFVKSALLQEPIEAVEEHKSAVDNTWVEVDDGIEDEVAEWEAASDAEFDLDDDDDQETALEDEAVEESPPESPVVHDLAVRQPAPVAPIGGGITQSSSLDQKGDPQVEMIVDGLFDRMKATWGPRNKTLQEEQRKQRPSDTALVATKRAISESRAEISKVIKREVPSVIKGELVTLLRTEIMTAVRSEIVRVVREEFDQMNRSLAKSLDRLGAIESRLAKIEGAVGKEIKVNFPKGMVKIDAPITIPEREVKVAAPINVQPPSVTFDQGAISVQFNKSGGGSKTVHFERDPHDQCVKSATIVNGDEQ